jgi:hypothetical protein
MADPLYQYYVRHFPLRQVYLIYAMFRELALLPSSGDRLSIRF